MSEITPDYIERYLEGLVPRDEFLEKLEVEGAQRGIPIISASEGFLLYLLAKISKASTILELGTAIGYSTIWLARALPKEGKIITIERFPEIAQEAERNIEKAGLADRVQILVGEAKQVISDISEEFDIIFNDADKEEYPELLDLMLPRLKKGGILLTDNTLWFGKVAKENRDQVTEAVHEYNRRLSEDPELETSIIPIRDGLSITLKKG